GRVPVPPVGRSEREAEPRRDVVARGGGERSIGLASEFEDGGPDDAARVRERGPVEIVAVERVRRGSADRRLAGRLERRDRSTARCRAGDEVEERAAGGEPQLRLRPGSALVEDEPDERRRERLVATPGRARRCRPRSTRVPWAARPR